MDIQIKNYTFDAVAKTITFSDYSAIRLDSVRVIANVTAGIIIYTFTDPNLGGNVLNNVLSLDYDTSAMNNGDALQIIYNNDEIKATEANQELMLIDNATLINLVQTLSELSARLQVLTGMANSGAPALRVLPIASVNINGSVSVANATIAYEGGVPSYVIAIAQMNENVILSNINNVIGK